MVEPGHLVSETLKREFGEEALSALNKTDEEAALIGEHVERVFSNGVEVRNVCFWKKELYYDILYSTYHIFSKVSMSIQRALDQYPGTSIVGLMRCLSIQGFYFLRYPFTPLGSGVANVINILTRTLLPLLGLESKTLCSTVQSSSLFSILFFMLWGWMFTHWPGLTYALISSPLSNDLSQHNTSTTTLLDTGTRFYV